MGGSSTQNPPNNNTMHKPCQLPRPCADYRPRKRLRSMTEGHTPCSASRQPNTTCSLPENRRRWKPPTASHDAKCKAMGKAATDAVLWRQKREAKGDMLEGAEQRGYNQKPSDDNANPNADRLELSIEQQIERLNPARTADFLFSHFTMVPGETHFLRSMMTADMKGLGLSHGQGFEASSNRESRHPTEVAQRTPPPQQYPTEEALLYYTFGSAEHDSEPALQTFNIWESALGRE